jgi:acetoacetate decarboxylase
MATQGLLKKAAFGYSMPVDTRLYPPFPIEYEHIRILLFPYLTDSAKAAALLPEQLQLIEPSPGVAMAQVIFAKYPFSNIGAYNEVSQTIFATYNGQPVAYAVRLHVTTDRAMAAGREIGGFPKRMGHISFDEGETFSSVLESPRGTRICSGELLPIQPFRVNGKSVIPLPLNFVSLRVIPNPLDSANPSICQLIGSEWNLTDGDLWEADGGLVLTGASTLCPYHALPIVAPMPAAVARAIPAPVCGYFEGAMGVGNVQVLVNF